MNRIEGLLREASRASDFARGYFSYVQEVLSRVDTDEIAGVVEALRDARERAARIFIIGNGGSAATASHMANDIGIGTRSWERPFHVVSLTDNVSVLTAIANDYGYAEVFIRQLQTQLVAGDLVIAISASGNSPNIVSAVEYANGAGAVTVGFTGFDGGRLRRIASLGVHVPTEKGEYGPVEDVHMVLDHLIGAYLLHVCRSSDGGRP